MESLTRLFKIGVGPSSSHTMGPKKAVENFFSQFPDGDFYRVTLYGALAATGRGHLTDKAIESIIHADKLDLVWKPDQFLEKHPNGLLIEKLDRQKNVLASRLVYSIGGGSILVEGENPHSEHIYGLKTFSEIMDWAENNGKRLWEYVTEVEGEKILDYLKLVWKKMNDAVHKGLEHEGVLPGVLKLPRKASSYYARSQNSEGFDLRINRVFAYALAVAEENAAGGEVVTAPTCGSSGVLPAVLLNVMELNKLSETRLLRALATAGLIGNIVKKNGSISGAEVGCQGEIGTACAMAAGAAVQLFGGSNSQIEYAAEMGLEHNLGLTCDPVAGLVQIPCIERNAMAAVRAISCAYFALHSDGSHKVHLDSVISTMYQTGKDLLQKYRETSTGGLAALYKY